MPVVFAHQSPQRFDMPAVIASSLTPSDRLLRVLTKYDRFLVVMHDNPDPDVIATAWSVQCLIEDKLHKPTRIVGGGAIVRAENKHMVELLQPPIELVTGDFGHGRYRHDPGGLRPGNDQSPGHSRRDSPRGGYRPPSDRS